MTKSIRRYEVLQDKILPAIPSLTTMTKFSFNMSEHDKIIIDKSILSFLNIFNSIKSLKLLEKDRQIVDKIIQNGLLDNLIEILDTFFKTLIDNELNKKIQLNKSNSIILMDTFKNIIKIFQLLCEQSENFNNTLINMNVLEMIYTILKEELCISNSKSNSQNSHHSVVNELLRFLQSLFIESKNIIPTQTYIDNQTKLFVFFSEKMIPLLIENYVNISSSSISIKIIKLLKIYCLHAKFDTLEKYLNSSKVANILSSK
jgi:hypothetical protein